MAEQEELRARLEKLESVTSEHDQFIRMAQEMFNPLNKAMADTFLNMVLAMNPINEEEKAALELVRQDIGAAPVDALTLGLHAAEREILDGELTETQRTAWTATLIVFRAELVKRGVTVETGEKEVRAALRAADAAGRVQVDHE